MKRLELFIYENARRLDSKILGFSKEAWPFSMALLCLVGLAATLLDFMSTYVALEFSENPIEEGNKFSRSILETGGWQALLVKDFLVVAIYTLIAFSIYQIAARRNIAGMGRLLSVVLLQVYLWARLIPAVNNVIIAML